MCLTKHTHTASTVSAVPAVERSKSVARPEFARPGEGSALGICWFSGPPDCIRRLNALVDEKVAQFVEDAKRTGEPLPVEVTAVLSGDVVYKDRIIWVPLFYMFLAAVILAAHVPSHPLTIAAAAVVSFFWYDVFSGILHKSLDDPDFIALPVLREPCLEFQWHHHIPHDLASKPFLQVCGDLNLVMTVLFVAYVCPGVGFCYRSPTALCLVASKILMAYFGQLVRLPVPLIQAPSPRLFVCPCTHFQTPVCPPLPSGSATACRTCRRRCGRRGWTGPSATVS
jgi:hypothetical protein